MKILTAAEMRKAEEEGARIGIPASQLMENAGLAVAEKTKQLLGNPGGQSILFLIGPGNNGGDGLVAARYLHDWGAKVSLCLCGGRLVGDPNLEKVQSRNIPSFNPEESPAKLEEALASATAVVDSLFGTGKSRPLQGVFAEVLEQVAQVKQKRPELKIIALDLPSGLNTDTGVADPACLTADYTITLGFPKTGLFSFPGMEKAGRVMVVDIGIPENLVEEVLTEVSQKERVKSTLPRRPSWANKGTFGRVLMVAGSVHYVGAAYLACQGAVRVGAGLVTLATPRSLQPVLAGKLTEVTYLPLPESGKGIISPGALKRLNRELAGYEVLAMGCGLGQTPPAFQFVSGFLLAKERPPVPLVLDADALNALARVPNWWQIFTEDAVLTPHPGEMARLAGLFVEEVQSDRIGVARKSAAQWRKTVVLKGAHTVVAAPDGRVEVSMFTNPGLASAGTGDVLTGAIAGLVAQGLSFFDAAVAGVYIHGEAGELVRARLGEAGMLASDLLPFLPVVIKGLKEER